MMVNWIKSQIAILCIAVIWLGLILTNLPLISIIPAFSLCVNMFWLGYFEEKYISIDYKNSNNIINSIFSK